MSETVQTIKVQGYEFTGEAELLKYAENLNWEEVGDIVAMAKWKSKLHIYDSKLGHLVITNSTEHPGLEFLISKL